MSLYQKIFARNKQDIPRLVNKKFMTMFRHPVSVEWMRTGDDFEALFYENRREMIARFDPEGNLKETRVNRLPQEFPELQNPELSRKGTVVNFIEIKKGDSINYELIINRPDQIRQLLLLDAHYQVLREESL